jgi:hypothetical protein
MAMAFIIVPPLHDQNAVLDLAAVDLSNFKRARKNLFLKIITFGGTGWKNIQEERQK